MTAPEPALPVADPRAATFPAAIAIPPGRPKSGARLRFLDGLRALACLYVLVFHESNAKVEGHGEPSPFVNIFVHRVMRGHFGVVFFIVLSGFSLMLPIARSGAIELTGGIQNYAYRRARRIFPPYYAALALSLASIVAYNFLAASHSAGQPIEAALRPGSVISHLLLVHNLTFEWAYRINGPMWSVATEWQIYFVFVAALLPLWRRFGAVVTVCVAWVAGSLPFFLLPSESNFFWACPWFIGSFALGMAGAVIGFAPQYQDSPIRNMRWGMWSLVCFSVLAALCATGRADSWGYPIVDLVVSLFAFCWINACVQRSASEAGSRGTMLRMLGSRFLVYVGGFSYSLYLVQHPLLRFTEKFANRLPLSYDANVAFQLIVATPLVMGFAWLFSELFERPFTSGAVLLPALQRRWRPHPSEA